MRTDIVHIGAGELTYEIRNIVNVGMKLQALGIKTFWENIGDPIRKGEPMPAWEKANMLAKYYVTTKALEMCR